MTVGWVSMKDQIRDTYDWGPLCGPGHPLCDVDEAGVQHPGGPSGHIPQNSLLGMFAIGMLSRIACFAALVGTNRHKQV